MPTMVIEPDAAGPRAQSRWLSTMLERGLRGALRVNAAVLGSVSELSADVARRLEDRKAPTSRATEDVDNLARRHQE
jgi:hypothetical protein